MMRIGIFASGRGTTAAAIMDACNSGAIQAEVSCLVTNNSAARAAQEARDRGFPAYHISSATHPDERERAEEMRRVLAQSGTSHIVLAGYMKRLPNTLVTGFSGRVFNTHPALLPDFGGVGMYGERVHRAVLTSGVVWSGATLHLVDDDYDTGRVLCQSRLKVDPSNTWQDLAARIQVIEKDLLIAFLASEARSCNSRVSC